jgi:thiol-activated cytolysin
MKKSDLVIRLFLTALAGIILYCTTPVDEGENTTKVDDITNFNDHVVSLDYLIQPEQLEEPVLTAAIDSSEPSDNYVCSIKRYKAAPGYSELFLMDPTTDVIYPGALLKGESIITGEYIPIIAKRKPLTISVSLQNISGSPSRNVEDPKLSTIRESINDILSSELTGATPARISFEIQEVHSAEQLKLAVQGNYKSSKVNISTGFNFNKQDVRSRFVVKFLQIYYTIDIDLPKQPSDLFEEMPDLGKLGSSSPVYISTVTYGRMALFTVESNYSSNEMNAALNATFSSVVKSGSISIESQYSRMINNSTLKAFILGGSGADAVLAVNGVEGVTEFITKGGNYTKDSPGAALSYKLRYLKDNSVTNIVLASEYNVRQCQKVFSKYEVKLENVVCTNADGDGSEAELFGWLAVTSPDTSDTLWRFDDNHYQSGNILTINATTRITIPNAGSNSFIVLSGHLIEYDSGDPNDNLGIVTKNVYVSEFDGTSIELNFNGGGVSATAMFTITPVD